MIYLASASPRRAELLAQIGVEFKVIVGDIDETPLPGESADDLVTRLSHEKAIQGCEQLAPMREDDLVIAADTAISLNGQPMGKPDSVAHCCSMLGQLSGQRHRVVTAVAIVNRQGQLWASCSRNQIHFRALEAAEIGDYCASSEPMDKAGAYAIQGKAAIFIEHLEGSYSSVMGLPLFETAQLLKQAGYRMQFNKLAT